jgi:hypothetical protein
MADMWERQPGEPPKAYAAFCIYRDTDPSKRGYGACIKAQNYNNPTSRLRVWAGWSSRYHWVERVAAYDKYKDEQGRLTDLQAIKEMRTRHIDEARALQSKAIARLKTLQPEDLKPGELLRYFIEASKLERLAMGLETEHLDLTTNGKSIKNMEDDELTDYIKGLLREVDSGVAGSTPP